MGEPLFLLGVSFALLFFRSTLRLLPSLAGKARQTGRLLPTDSNPALEHAGESVELLPGPAAASKHSPFVLFGGTHRITRWPTFHTI